MSRIKKKELAIGVFLMVTFIAVMVGIFMPLFDEGNALNYLDNLYNSISKGSANYIPKVEHQVEDHGSEIVTLNLKMADPDAARAAEPLFSSAPPSIQRWIRLSLSSGSLSAFGGMAGSSAWETRSHSLELSRSAA